MTAAIASTAKLRPARKQAHCRSAEPWQREAAHHDAITGRLLPLRYWWFSCTSGWGVNPHEIPSPLINKPAPAFTLPQLYDPAKQFSSQEMKGQVWLLNVWASWCVSCREEHPVLMELSQHHIVPIYGLDYKDTNAEGEAWLREGGDPYTLVATDANGHVGIDYRRVWRA